MSNNHARRKSLQKRQKTRNQFLHQHKPRRQWSQSWSKTHSSVCKVLGKIDIFMSANVHLWLNATSSPPLSPRGLSGGVWQKQKIIKWKRVRHSWETCFLISKSEWSSTSMVSCTSRMCNAQMILWWLTSCCKSLMILVFFSISTLRNLIWRQKETKEKWLNRKTSCVCAFFKSLNIFNEGYGGRICPFKQRMCN